MAKPNIEAKMNGVVNGVVNDVEWMGGLINGVIVVGMMRHNMELLGVGYDYRTNILDHGRRHIYSNTKDMKDI